MNRLFRMITLLCICMLFTGIQPAQAREIDPGLSGSNVGSQNYINNQRWTVPVRSYLTETAKGLMIFDGADDGYTAAYYNDDHVLQDTVSIAKELPLFGGFHAHVSHFKRRERGGSEESAFSFKVLLGRDDGCFDQYGPSYAGHQLFYVQYRL